MGELTGKDVVLSRAHSWLCALLAHFGRSCCNESCMRGGLLWELTGEKALMLWGAEMPYHGLGDSRVNVHEHLISVCSAKEFSYWNKCRGLKGLCSFCDVSSREASILQRQFLHYQSVFQNAILCFTLSLDSVSSFYFILFPFYVSVYCPSQCNNLIQSRQPIANVLVCYRTVFWTTLINSPRLILFFAASGRNCISDDAKEMFLETD